MKTGKSKGLLVFNDFEGNLPNAGSDRE